MQSYHLYVNAVLVCFPTFGNIPKVGSLFFQLFGNTPKVGSLFFQLLAMFQKLAPSLQFKAVRNLRQFLASFF